jgi:hypothetical protein
VNSLDSFTQSLNRQVLSELSRKLFEDQFGEGSIKPEIIFSDPFTYRLQLPIRDF